MNKNISAERFVSLVDVALKRAQLLKVQMIDAGCGSGAIAASEVTINSLQRLKVNVLEDKLPRVSKGQVPIGTGLGLSRAIGEWTEDEELIAAARSIEKYFGENW